MRSIHLTMATDFLARRVAVTPVEYCALLPADKPAAFTISGVDSLKVIQAIRAEILDALRRGDPFGQFLVRSNGCFVRAGLPAPSASRLERLFQTETATAFAVIRAEHMLSDSVRRAAPWWQYLSVRDSRPSHAVLDGFIARWDDPVWLTIYPLNAPCCRCMVRPRVESDARELAGDRALEAPGIARLPSGLRVRYPHSVIPFILGTRPFLRR